MNKWEYKITRNKAGAIAIEKKCLICGKPFTDYSKSRSKNTCSLKCRMEYYYKTNPDKSFTRKVNLRVGILRHKGVVISPEELIDIKEKLLKGECEICHGAFDLNRLDIDHSHVTNKYREPLCDRCNQTLGIVQENTQTLQNMINYLEA